MTEEQDHNEILNTLEAKIEELFNGGRNTSLTCLQDTKPEHKSEHREQDILTEPEDNKSQAITIIDNPVNQSAIIPVQHNSLKLVEADDFMPTIDRWTRLGSLFLVGSVGIAIALSAFTPYRVTVQAQAKIRPAGELRIVEAETEGTVVDIAVKGNQKLNRGDVIATIDNSRLETKKSQLESNIQQATLQIQQIQAQITAHNSRLLAETDRNQRMITSAEAEFNRRRREYQDKQIITATEVEEAKANLRAAQAALNAAKSKLNRYQAAASEGALSQNQLEEVQVTVEEQEQAVEANQARVRRAHATLDPIDAEVAIAIENIAQEKASGQATLAILNQEKEALIQQQIEIEQQRSRDKQELEQIEKDLDQTAIKATADGILFQLNLRNSGQTVTLGEEIAQIAPLSNSLFIKALIPAQEIDKVKIDQRVQMKVSACPYPDYGTLRGLVSNIAPDAITAQDSNPNSHNSKISSQNLEAGFYQVTIKPQNLALGKGENQCKIQSGMEGRTDIITQEETVLQFLLRKARLVTNM